ncbi:hypothetical protein A2U01_0090506, partial [Trifolium medium]|nr:hypothetical protein [Trifolium medium]
MPADTGTSGWEPPEWLARRTEGSRADTFGVGLILYLCLT